ncbi:MRPL45 [Cordylochernes scorpioides]|uniref:Large ribosomal subunit protein mL45 n=1 Tax=Cordylochernes scorpioides TaxID=51811 RepID=A0ABY6K9D2_9ARAC|nr:MRPL45 [Cordylochernes scorpioides]
MVVDQQSQFQFFRKESWLGGWAVVVQKHYNQKWRKHRGEKVFKIKLPDFEEFRQGNNMSPDEMRSYMKEKGVVPSRPWNERPMYLSCTSGIIEPYIPPEKDEKYSVVSKAGAKQKYEWGKKKFSSHQAVKSLRVFEEEFDVSTFLDEASKIYVDAHKALCEGHKQSVNTHVGINQSLIQNKELTANLCCSRYDEDKLHRLVTDHCYSELCYQTNLKTMHWDMVETLERPRMVNCFVSPEEDFHDTFGQITVRFHTLQKLAVYDRFGRLIYGSEDASKRVLEYVVFEKQLSNQYGTWKLHSKIIPKWAPTKDQPIPTRAIKLEETQAAAAPAS